VSALGFAVTTLDAIALPASSDEDDQLETHDTFAANALAKARYYHALSGGCPTRRRRFWTGGGRTRRCPWRTKPTLGPVPSAARREVSAANNAALLARLHGLADRAARFVCAVAYVDASHSVTCSGYVIGRIANESRGNAGFGYDPVFEPDELGGPHVRGGFACGEGVHQPPCAGTRRAGSGTEPPGDQRQVRPLRSTKSGRLAR
jgi:XTP/dITP diphosphohydrolase